MDMATMSSIVLLLHLLWCVMLCSSLGGGAANHTQLRRQKRDWVIPTKTLKENVDYSTKGTVAKIRSDWDEKQNMFYFLVGHGATEEPVNLFVVDGTTGEVRVRGKLDREERETYTLTGMARFNNGTVAEDKIDLRFDVEDENDNPPVFVSVPPAIVNESSPAGTLVATVQATDADKASTSHSKIAYHIEKQEPYRGEHFFYIHGKTGSIYVNEGTLDRENQSSYILTIKGTDMDGNPAGNTGTCTLHVKIGDINDNIPTLEKDEYSVSITENTANVEVMRFKVHDSDEENTDNWMAVFDIVTGNEDGVFSIKTDPKTNEGVLMLEKPVDFEETPDIKLGVVVSNVASPVGDGGGDGGGGGGGAKGGTAKTPSRKKRPKKLYAVNIAVLNQPEGGTFKPSVKPVSISENPKDNPLMEVIAVFAATDTDTGKPAENVRYAKGYDPDNWLLIDPDTAEIRLQKAPDRESPFVVNGTYYAEILSLSQDIPSKTATGTIALQVGDVNDNCPTLTNRVQYICSDTEVVNITAKDEDGDPNSAPLAFSLVAEERRGEWRVEPLNDTSASLRALRPLWPGQYRVSLIIQDQQGLACPDPQLLELHVCTCEEGGTCRVAGTNAQQAFLWESSSTFGGVGLGAMILGLLTLLFLGLLLITCSCGAVPGTFSELPIDTIEHLIVYHTEGRGEDKDVPLLSPQVLMTPAVKSATQANKVSAPMALNNTYKFKLDSDGMVQESSYGPSQESWTQMYSAEMEEQVGQYGGIDDIALPDVFLHQYYSQNASCAAEKQAVRDCQLDYAYEGQGSSVGSMGSCSLLQFDDDLQFLDDLGPKFKTLADICSPARPPTPPTPENIAIPQVDKADHIVMPSLETKPPNIHSKILKDHQNVSQSSTSLMGFNRTTTGSIHGQSSHRSGTMAHSTPISAVTTAMLPPAGQQLLLQQQPVYYTTTPVLQQMHYLVQPQLQSTVLLQAPVTNLQGMVLLKGHSGHTEHILHGANTAGTSTLGGTRLGSVPKEIKGVGTCSRSEGPEVVTGIRKSSWIKSEGGARAEQCHANIEMLPATQNITLIDRQIGVGAARYEEGQVVFTERAKKRRTQSTSAETG
ncbi:desmoglein-2-like [Thunnus maccoyii]|uniref:desmoglein-2-like n=1 Tax=Thunnus maccoyii TaxID=8240 RepID=UPI001C4BD034|nr:desmoglein-2-like [Thunnus maccoyii]